MIIKSSNFYGFSVPKELFCILKMLFKKLKSIIMMVLSIMPHLSLLCHQLVYIT